MKRFAEVKKLRSYEVEIYKLSLLTSQFLSFWARDELLPLTVRNTGGFHGCPDT